MKFLSAVKSDFYKSFHTPVWLMHVIIPVVGLLMFVWYFSFSAMKEMDKLFSYMEVLSVVFPVLISLVTSVVAETEQQAAGCQLLLTFPGGKWIPHFSKMVVILLYGFFASLLAAVGFGIGFRGLGYTLFPLAFYLKTAVLLFLSMLPLYFLHYIVSFLCGKGYSIGLGIVGSLAAALLATGLGDSIWWMLPWGIASRYSLNLLAASQADICFWDFQEVSRSSVMLALSSVILLALCGTIFRRWEGSACSEIYSCD